MAPHSGILAWETPQTEEPGGLQLVGSQSRTPWQRLNVHTPGVTQRPCLPLLVASHFQPALVGHSTEAVTSLPTPPSFMVAVYSLRRV